MPAQCHPSFVVVFLFFFIFYFRFLQKYIFVFKIYRNIPRPPRCRAAGTCSPRCGAAGVFLQKFLRRICAEAPGGPVARQRDDRPPRPPGSGAAGPGRPVAGRLPPPALYKGLAAPTTSFASLKIQKKKEKRGREGGRRSPAGFSSRRLQVTKIFYTL